MEKATQLHNIPPLYDKSSRVLILGSFPSVKSREAAFFYAHPQNRFWPTLAAVLDEATPKTVEDKRSLVLRHGIALWDVIASCEITGSADSSIKNVVANDLSPILTAADIRQIFVNGKTAEKYYRKYTEAATGRAAVCLPSTSPANAAWSMERLIAAWRSVRDAAQERDAQLAKLDAEQLEDI